MAKPHRQMPNASNHDGKPDSTEFFNSLSHKQKFVGRQIHRISAFQRVKIIFRTWLLDFG
jgi:hypothetical protein